jgi:hypothetical protein
MKSLIKIILFVFALSVFPAEVEAQQDEMFKQKKERKRLWRRWKKNREAYNPYLKEKGKKKTSSRIAKGNRKEARLQRRTYQKELRRTRKKHGIKTPPKRD